MVTRTGLVVFAIAAVSLSGCFDGETGGGAAIAEQITDTSPAPVESSNGSGSKGPNEVENANGDGLTKNELSFAAVFQVQTNGFPVLNVTGSYPLGQYSVSARNGTFAFASAVEGPGEYPVPFLRTGSEYSMEWTIEDGNQTRVGEVHLGGDALGRQSSRSLENDTPRIYPGMKYWMDSGSWCTLGFLAWGPHGELFALTAGHCALKPAGWIAHEVRFMDGTPFGSFVAGENDRTLDERDWALIRIDDEFIETASAAVPRWGGATRFLPQNWGYADPVCWYGQAIMYSHEESTQGRCGAFDTWYSTNEGDYAGYPSARGQFWVDGDSDSGDSGAPVIHMESGAPVGTLIGGVEGIVAGEHPCIHFERALLQGYLLELALAQQETMAPGELPIDVPVAGTIGAEIGYTNPGCREDVVAWHGTHGPAIG